MIHPTPQLRDVVHRLADEDRFEKLDDCRHRFGAEITGVSLTDARWAAGCYHLDEGRTAELAGFAQKRVVGAGAGQERRSDVSDSHVGLGRNVSGATSGSRKEKRNS